MRRVGIAILGANGYMGRNAIKALQSARKHLAPDDIHLELIGLADPVYFDRAHVEAMEAARRDAIQVFRDLNPCSLFKDAESAIALFTNQEYRPFRSSQDIPEITIIYDATPTNDRSALMSQVIQAEHSEIYYLGEKPLLIDPQWLHKNAQLKDKLPIYCDFIETSNPIIEKLHDIIRTGDDGRGLTIDAMHFWRTGASGLKHLVGHNQKGVQGGAILDKAAHDVSISTMLLGPDHIAEFETTNAEIVSFITTMKEGKRFFLNSRCALVPIEEMSLDFKSRDSSRMLLPADGLATFSTNWKLNNGRHVPATYLVGWLGYFGFKNEALADPREQYFTKRLSDLGYPEAVWLMREEHQGSASQLTCIETQARIAIVDVTDSKGNKSTLVANLIATGATNGTPAIKRWLDWHRSDGGPPEIQRLNSDSSDGYSVQKQTDLADIISRVVMDSASLKEAKYLGSRACYFVHCAMLDARDVALAKAHEKMSSNGWVYEPTEQLIASAIFEK